MNIQLEHISIRGAFFRTLMRGLPDFEATFVFNSDGSWSVSSHTLTLQNQAIQKWRKIDKQNIFSRLDKFELDYAIEFISLGHTFYIVDKVNMDMAFEFFTKHINRLKIDLED